MLAFYLLLSPLSVLLFAGLISIVEAALNQSSFSHEGCDND
jgi:hypothetical protein